MENAILEIIACSLRDAIEAERGGANRLEIISRFDAGGFTPSFELVREIKSKVSLPLRVMIRESEDYRVRDEAEIENLCLAALNFSKIGVDGVVLGFLQNGEVDLELTKRILANAPDLKATFHHAFEETKDKFAAIEKLKKLPQIDRILTHGGSGKWSEKYTLLENFEQTAKPQIKILAGGGINAETIRLLRTKTSVKEFHVGSAARIREAVKKEQVAKLVETIYEV